MFPGKSGAKLEAASLPPKQTMDLPPLVVWVGAMPLGDGPHGGLLRLLGPLSAAGHRLLLTLIPEALGSNQSQISYENLFEHRWTTTKEQWDKLFQNCY